MYMYLVSNGTVEALPIPLSFRALTLCAEARSVKSAACAASRAWAWSALYRTQGSGISVVADRAEEANGAGVPKSCSGTWGHPGGREA